MALLGSILLNNIAPVFLTAGAGFLFGRWLRPDSKAISRLAFYVLSPCLVFDSLTGNGLESGEFWRMAVFAVVAISLSGLVAYAFGAAFRLPRAHRAALRITVMFVNGGNYGLSLNLFAYGQAAMSRAVVYFVCSTIMVYTVGVFVAGRGRASAAQALTGVLRVPAIYALILAGLSLWSGLALPAFALRPIQLLSRAAIPVMLIVLGLQMAEARRPQIRDLRTVGLSTALRLVGGPLIGLAVAGALDLSGPARQAAVTEAAMPPAVISTILALEYDSEPLLVTSIVVISTLLSPIVLTPLIAYLQA